MEVERKWLVDEPPPAWAMAAPAEPIAQGYLAVEPDGTEVRLRRRAERCWLTVKSGRGLVRGEFEAELSSEQFDGLWPGTEGRRLEKTRRVLQADGGVAIELDEYAGAHAGLMVAEVEFPDADCAGKFEPPGWFGPEVTGDERYANQRLAVAAQAQSPTPVETTDNAGRE